MVGTGHDATRVFLRRAGRLFAVARVSAVERAQVGFLTPTFGLDRHPRLRVRAAVLPQSRAQLRRDDHAAPHDQARPADRRRSAATCSRTAQGEAGAEIPAERPRDRHEPLRAVVEAHAESRLLLPGPRRLLEPQQGLRRHVLLRSLRPRRRSRRRRRCRAKAASPTPTGRGTLLARAQGFQTLQDPTAPPARRPTTACRRRS